MRYFINERNGAMTNTTDNQEAERLLANGYKEVSEEVYTMEYRKAYFYAIGYFDKAFYEDT